MSPSHSSSRTYKPGDVVPVSGMYRVLHGPEHGRDSHVVVAIRGEQFPPCRVCRQQVSFTIQRQASHCTHDWDFAGPASQPPAPAVGTPAQRRKSAIEIVGAQRQSRRWEARAAPRFPWRLPVSVKLVGGEGSETHNFTRDISRRGIFFFSPASLPLQAELECVVLWPPDGPLPAGGGVRCRGKVVRVEELPDRTFGIAIIGESRPFAAVA